MAADQGITFDNLFVTDFRKPNSLEDSIRAYAANAEIYDVSIRDLFSEGPDDDWRDAGKWDWQGGTRSLTTVHDHPTLVLTPTTPNNNNSVVTMLCDSAYKPGRNGKLSIVVPQDCAWSVLFRASDYYDYYAVQYDSNGRFGFIRGGFNALASLVPNHLAYYESDAGLRNLATDWFKLDLYWKEMRYSTIDTKTYLLATAVLNDGLFVSMFDEIDPINPPDTFIGMRTFFNESYFSDLKVTDLGEPDEWSAIDIGSAPLGAIQSMLDGRNVRLQERFDGSLKVWKPQTGVDPVWTMPTDGRFNVSRLDDTPPQVTHARMIGAWDQADYVHQTENKKKGHRFARFENPYLMNEDEAYEGAKRAVFASMERADMVQLTGPYVAMLEKEDVITLPEGDYIIDNMRILSDGPSLLMTLDCRRQVLEA